MADEDLDEPPNEIVLINKNEAWNIINNQIEVQEQLRNRGYQILSIFSAVAVLIAGISLSLSFTVPESAFENAIDSFWLSEFELSGFIVLHWIMSFLLVGMSSFLAISYIIRNYEASRHSSLKPGLGEGNKSPPFFITTDKNQNILDEHQVAAQQYNKWITSNAEILQEKRKKLNIAHYNLLFGVLCLCSAVFIYYYSNNVLVVPLSWIDILFFLLIVTYTRGLLKTRDEWRDWRSWPITEKQEANSPYLGTTEFFFIMIFSLTFLALLLAIFSLLAVSFLGEYGIIFP